VELCVGQVQDTSDVASGDDKDVSGGGGERIFEGDDVVGFREEWPVVSCEHKGAEGAFPGAAPCPWGRSEECSDYVLR
jgi:hypothetical protein